MLYESTDDSQSRQPKTVSVPQTLKSLEVYLKSSESCPSEDALFCRKVAREEEDLLILFTKLNNLNVVEPLNMFRMCGSHIIDCSNSRS